MKHDEKRTLNVIDHDIKKAVNKNIYSQYKTHILVSIFLTVLLLISSLITSHSSAATPSVAFIIGCLFMVMTIVLNKLYKKARQKEQNSMIEIQQAVKSFYS